MVRSAARGLTAGLLVLLGACARPAAEVQRFERATMAEIAEAVTLALPLSASEERLADPAARETFEASLRTLALHAERLETHGKEREASFAYLSRSLADDARDALRRFERGQTAEAQFVLQQLVDDCVACHSRLPSPENSALGVQLLRHVRMESLSLPERARVQSATRQFDAALDSYERLFHSQEMPPGQLDLQGLLTDYLILCVRVKDDLARPRPILAQLAERPDTPAYLARDLRSWVRALETLERRPEGPPPLARARGLVQEAQLRGDAMDDRGGLVHAVMASSLLHRAMRAGLDAPGERAEAYYLLGLTETRIHHSYWLSEAEFYLETAVRTAPNTVHAELAYALLEQETLAGYTGSGGVHLPEDVRLRLEELRALIDQP